MNRSKERLLVRFVSGVVAACLTLVASGPSLDAQSFPQYDHVFLLIMENENYNQVIGNANAPILNALAQDYGLATNYSGVADPSEPNYVAMLGGHLLNITSEDPYWFPGNTVNANNLMSQLEAAGKTWRGYFQSMPYPGYRGYCYPDKCNSIPDADTQYVTKHNGIVNFADLQTPTELAKMFPLPQLTTDLAAGAVPNFSYIVPNECNDMHGAPPWCVDSDNTGTVQQSWLIAQGDKFVGSLVNQITSSSMWQTGNNAIVVTFDEGNTATSQIVTIVITNHGPRGVTDKTSFNHYSLLASLQQTFGLGCLLNSCTATPMTNLFAVTGSTTVPTLPPPFNFPASSDTISAQGAERQAASASLTGSGWMVVPSYSFGSRDNILAGVSAASLTDAWAVGAYYPSSSNVLATLAQHFDGTRWTAFPLPNVGVQENVLYAVSMPSAGKAWKGVSSPAYTSASVLHLGVTATASSSTIVGEQETDTAPYTTYAAAGGPSGLSIQTTPNAGTGENDLFAVATAADGSTWAVGWDLDTNTGNHDPLILQAKNGVWSLDSTPSLGNGTDSGFAAITAIPGGGLWAVGVTAPPKGAGSYSTLTEFHP